MRVQRGSSDFPDFALRGAARLSFTARIEGAHSDRAASASKKDGLAVPLPPFETARCASTDLYAPSKLARYTLQRVAWISPQLRTSNDHSFIVGVP
jgi:hypothetical protein